MKIYNENQVYLFLMLIKQLQLVRWEKFIVRLCTCQIGSL